MYVVAQVCVCRGVCVGAQGVCARGCTEVHVGTGVHVGAGVCGGAQMCVCRDMCECKRVCDFRGVCGCTLHRCMCAQYVGVYRCVWGYTGVCGGVQLCVGAGACVWVHRRMCR